MAAHGMLQDAARIHAYIKACIIASPRAGPAHGDRTRFFNLRLVLYSTLMMTELKLIARRHPRTGRPDYKAMLSDERSCTFCQRTGSLDKQAKQSTHKCPQHPPAAKAHGRDACELEVPLALFGIIGEGT